MDFGSFRQFLAVFEVFKSDFYSVHKSDFYVLSILISMTYSNLISKDIELIITIFIKTKKCNHIYDFHFIHFIYSIHIWS